MKKTLSIILPCHNEEESIIPVLYEVKRAKEQILNSGLFTDVKVVVVDDGSTDKSVELLSSIEDIVLIRNLQKMGYGESLKKGFSHGYSDYFCFLDLDCSYPPEYIMTLASRAVENQNQMVVGKRSLRDVGMSLTRGVGNSFYTWLSRSLLNVSLNDVCSGFRVLKHDLVQECLSFQNGNLSFALEMSLRFSADKYRVEEIEVPYRHRAGSSKLSLMFDGIIFLKLILKIFLQNILIQHSPAKAHRRR